MCTEVCEVPVSPQLINYRLQGLPTSKIHADKRAKERCMGSLLLCYGLGLIDCLVNVACSNRGSGWSSLVLRRWEADGGKS